MSVFSAEIVPATARFTGVMLKMKAVQSAVLKGKDPTKLATCIAYFAVLHAKNGRRIAGLAADDIFSQLAQERHGFTVRSLNDTDFPSAPGWEAAVTQDARQFSPADAASFKLDFNDWLGTLSQQERRLAKRLAIGDRPGDIARLARRSPAWVTKLRSELKKSWQVFRGEVAEQDAAVAGAGIAAVACG
jgi:hypothetical protein